MQHTGYIDIIKQPKTGYKIYIYIYMYGCARVCMRLRVCVCVECAGSSGSPGVDCFVFGIE